MPAEITLHLLTVLTSSSIPSYYHPEIQRCWAVCLVSPMNISKVCWCQQSLSAYIERGASAQETSWHSLVSVLPGFFFYQVRATLLWPTSTMISNRTVFLVATCCCAYLWLACAEDISLETRSSDFTLKSQQEKDLVRQLKKGAGLKWFQWNGQRKYTIPHV